MSAYIKREIRAKFDALLNSLDIVGRVSLKFDTMQKVNAWGYTQEDDHGGFVVCIVLDRRTCSGCNKESVSVRPADRCAHRACAVDTLIHELAHVMSWRSRGFDFGPDAEWGLWYSRIYHLVHGPH